MRRAAWMVLFLTVSAVMAMAARAETSSAPVLTFLRADWQESPAVIDGDSPRFSWIMTSARRGAAQSASRVRVFTRDERVSPSSTGAAREVTVWDSGRVEGDRSVEVVYAGPALSPAAEYLWSVKIWDETRAESAWAPPARFRTGLRDWRARWLQAPGAAPMTNGPLPLFRREFDIPRLVRRAVVYVTGLGQFELFLNGRRVGDEFLHPGWTNYKKTVLYSIHDVTAELAPGSNALGVMLGNGMYNVAPGRYTKFTGSFGPPKFILQLEVEYEDGTRETIVSDRAWTTTPGPIVFSSIYGGEDYDARAEQPAWELTGFDDRAWIAAEECDGPGGALRPATAPPVKVIATFDGRLVREISPGLFLYDLGDNFSGRPRVRVIGEPGSRGRIHPGEILKNGRATNNPGWSANYTLRGGREEEWAPQFTYSGFRYLEVEAIPAPGRGARPRLLYVGADQTHAALRRVGGFHCSNELFNRIEKMIDWSVVSNLQSVLTDCPHREKLGWLEVSHLMGYSIFYRYDAVNLYRKISRDMVEAQLDNGLVPDIAPEYVVFDGGFRDSAEWGSAIIIMPELLREFYGDDRTMLGLYPAMRRYEAYLTSQDGGIPRGGLGDWYEIRPPFGHLALSGSNPLRLTPVGFTAGAIRSFDCFLLNFYAERQGLADDAAEYAEKRERLNAALNAEFFNQRRGHYGSQTMNAMALWMELAPKELRERVLTALVEDVSRRGNKMNTGEIGFRYLITGLANSGRSDVVFDMLNRTNCPGYGCLLARGFTTLSERWDGRPGTSYNHAMYGHAQEWFSSRLLGMLAGNQRGWQKFNIAPEPVGGLTAAEGWYDSPFGRISVSWSRVGKMFDLRVEIPANTSALVAMPCAFENVRESGQLAGLSEGIIDRGWADGRCRFEVGGGRYRFESELPSPPAQPSGPL